MAPLTQFKLICYHSLPFDILSPIPSVSPIPSAIHDQTHKHAPSGTWSYIITWRKVPNPNLEPHLLGGNVPIGFSSRREKSSKAVMQGERLAVGRTYKHTTCVKGGVLPVLIATPLLRVLSVSVATPLLSTSSVQQMHGSERQAGDGTYREYFPFRPIEIKVPCFENIQI